MTLLEHKKSVPTYSWMYILDSFPPTLPAETNPVRLLTHMVSRNRNSNLCVLKASSALQNAGQR